MSLWTAKTERLDQKHKSIKQPVHEIQRRRRRSCVCNPPYMAAAPVCWEKTAGDEANVDVSCYSSPPTSVSLAGHRSLSLPSYRPSCSRARSSLPPPPPSPHPLSFLFVIVFPSFVRSFVFFYPSPSLLRTTLMDANRTVSRVSETSVSATFESVDNWLDRFQ